MAAVQPFLSGAISKTVNVPYRSSVEDISRLYTLAWEHGLKCVAVYRDGCKRSQPLDTGDRDAIRWEHPQVGRALAHLAGLLGVAEFDGAEDLARRAAQPRRRKLPDERRSVTRKFSIAGHDGYLHVGLHEDGTPGELFVRMSKEGSTISGLLDAWATTFSIALQYGAPLAKLCEKGMGTSFPPAGFTGDDLRSARSVVDYICTYLHRKFVEGCETNGAMGGGGVAHNSDSVAAGTIKNAHVDPVFFAKAGGIEGPPCDAAGCGGTTRRAGSCYVCERCGSTTGCG
jgi:ribonucleoside-diphosphate reductase alpha chain